MIVSVVGVETHLQLTQPFESWCVAEWGRIDPLIDPQGWYPPPLFALDEAGALVGGLAFTRRQSLDGDGPAVWINAVLVRRELRGRGIGSKLIAHAESTARSHGIARLYAHTDLPSLYTKQGWIVKAGLPDKVSKTIATSE